MSTKRRLKFKLLALMLVFTMVLAQTNGVSAEGLAELVNSSQTEAETSPAAEPSGEDLVTEAPSEEPAKPAEEAQEAELPSSDAVKPADPAPAEAPADPAPVEEPAQAEEPAEDPAEENAEAAEPAEDAEAPAEEAADPAEAEDPAEEAADPEQAEEPAEEPAEENGEAADVMGTGKEPAPGRPEIDKPIEVRPFVLDQTEYEVSLNEVTVRASVAKDAFEEEVELFVRVLEKGTDAWNEAKASLLAKGYTFDGMLAYDIGFASKATGAEVEPKGLVSVELEVQQAGLAEMTAKSIDATTIVVSHISGTTVEKVADSATKSGRVEMAADKLTASFNVDSFSTFTLTWKNADNEDQSATIHFGTVVDGAFSEFEQTTISFDTSANNINIANTFDGYTYRDAVYCASGVAYANGSDISSILYKTETGWAADVTTVDENENPVVTRTPIANGSDIYVRYYVPTDPVPSGDDPETIPSPTTTKTVTQNTDGTYTIQLDIAGSSVQSTEPRYVNVLIILDATRSMNGAKWTNAKAAMKALIETLVEGDNAANAGHIDFALVTFGRAATVNQDWTKNNTSFKTTCANVNMVTTFGTNWEAGMRGGLYGVLNSIPDNDPTYVIFLTDGDPNVYYSSGTATNYTDTGTTPGYEANAGTSANQSKDEAAAIAAKPTKLYGIYCFAGNTANTDSEEYRRLNDVICGQGQGGQKTIAATASTVENEFKLIAQAALSEMGANNVAVDDGVPSLSSVSATVSGAASGFEYYKSTDGVNYSVWEDAPGASYSNDNGVTWDLSSAGEVMANDYFRLKFTVWPSQAAYDTIADLNNGLITMTDAELTAAGIGYDEDNDMYYLLTNTHLNTTYTFKNQEYSDSPTTLPKEEMILPTETISVQKIWNNLIDQRNPPAEMALVLTRDGENYLSGTNAIKVSAKNGWKKDDIYISLGQIKKASNGTYEIIEPGHDYEITEPVDYTGPYRWELISEVYHPMMINGTKTMLIKDAEGTGGTEGVDYYMIEDVRYKVDTASTNTLKAWNDRRSWLQLEKKVTGEGADPDAVFTFTVTITDANGDDIWFSAWDGDTVKDPDIATATGIKYQLNDETVVSEKPSTDFNGYFSVPSGASITISVKAGWTVRFLNLPSETTYTITETSLPDGFQFVTSEGRIVKEAEDENYKEEPEVPAGGNITVSGTINVPNTEFYVDYTNKYEETSITVTKEWVDNNNQDGSRPTADEFTENISLLVNGTVSDAYDANLTITDNEDGTYTITYANLPVYIDNASVTYTVQETKVPDNYECDPTTPVANGEKITNTRNVASLTVTKTVVVPEGFTIDASQEFRFTVKITNSDTALTGTYDYTKSNADGTETTGKVTLGANGASFTLKHGETYTIDGLPVGANYEVTETAADGYTITAPAENPATGTITPEGDNTVAFENSFDTATLKLTKTASGLQGSDVVPDDAEFVISGTPTAAGVTFTPITVTYADIKAGTWSETVPVGEYTVTETGAEVAGYTLTVSYGGAVTLTKENNTGTLTVKNTYVQDTATLKLTKTFSGLLNNDVVPDTATFVISGKPIAAGVTFDDVTVTYKDIKDGNYELEVPVGTYSVTETGAEVVGYTLETTLPNAVTVEKDGEGTLTVNNAYTLIMIEVTVTKVWEDDENAVGLRPDAITVQLYKTVGETKTAIRETQVLKESNKWTYTWSQLAQYENGVLIEYSVEEIEVVPYVFSGLESLTNDLGYFELTLTNTLVTPVTDDPPVLKVITKDKPEEEDEFTFIITAEYYEGDFGDEVGNLPMPVLEGKVNDTLTITASDGKTEFGEITFYFPGTYVYTIKEKDTGLPGYKYDDTVYTLTYEITQDQEDATKMAKTLTITKGDEVVEEAVYVFTNEYTAPPIDIPVTKVWEGEVDAAKTRPESITVKLLADGADSGLTLELSEKNKWSDTFKDLPSQKDGVEIKYTIEEVEVKYYTTTIEGDMTKGFTITNTCTYIKTGDDSNILLWSAAMMASMAGIGFTLFKKKREEEER